MARISFIVAAAFATAGLLATVAYAGGGGASVDAYGGAAGKTQGIIHQAATGKVSGTLPFTGLNLALIVVAGLLLLLAGVALRRRKSHS